MMRIGKSLIGVLAIVLAASVVGAYVWQTIIVPVEVKEPLEILSYPSTLDLYAGETEEFNVTIQNHANVNYTVFLSLSLDNITYQNQYVSFSHKIYKVVSGIQKLAVWLKVESNAPPVQASLTINFTRGVYPSGLVGYWRFDEGVGVVVDDSSTENNHGTLKNGPLWVDGKDGKALSFDGSDDYVEIPDAESLRLQEFTLSGWIYMTERPYQHSSDPHVAMINKLNFSGPVKGYKLDFEYPTSINDDLVIAIGDGDHQVFLLEYNSIDDLMLNQWHHLVGTYDGIAAKLYIDGELKAISGPKNYTIVNDDTPLGIGQEITGASGHFSGLIDNVGIYNRALSLEEVQMLYKHGL